MSDHLKTLRELVARERREPRCKFCQSTRLTMLAGLWYCAGCHKHFDDGETFASLGGILAPTSDEWSNARPALAALLRFVEAAKAVSAMRDHAFIVSIAGRDAFDAFDAALRDLAPEVEDGE